MSARGTVNTWLNAMAGPMQIPDLALNENGVCAFTYDASVTLIIELNTEIEMLYLYAPLLPHTQQDAAFHDTLLKLNYRGQATQGATFARNPNDGTLVLCRTSPMSDLDSEHFFALLQTFLESAKSLWQQLATAPDPTPDSDDQAFLLKPSMRV